MKKISFENQKSAIFKLDTKIVAAIPYLLLIIFRLVNSIMFMFSSDTLSNLSFSDQIITFLSTYFNYIDLIFCFIPLIFILFDRKSKLIRFHSFQYLIINLFIPMIYILITGILMLIPVFKNNIYLYMTIVVFGLIQAIFTFVQVFILNDIMNNRTSNVPLVSKLAQKLANI